MLSPKFDAFPTPWPRQAPSEGHSFRGDQGAQCSGGGVILLPCFAFQRTPHTCLECVFAAMAEEEESQDQQHSQDDAAWRESDRMRHHCCTPTGPQQATTVNVLVEAHLASSPVMRAISAVLSKPLLHLACTISMIVLSPPLLCRRAGCFPGRLLTAALHALDRWGCFIFGGLVHAICGASRSFLLLRWHWLFCRGMSCLWDWGCRPWQRARRKEILIPRQFKIVYARYLRSRRIVRSPGCNIRQEAGTGPESCSKHWHLVKTVKQEAAMRSTPGGRHV